MSKAGRNDICGVILAAGMGSRIHPLSLSIPKTMIPICNKPIMEYQIEDMIRLGIREIYIVVGHLKQHIMSYFGDGSKWGVRITYVEQKQMLGIAHAIGQLEKYITKPMMIFLGDIFIIPQHLEQMKQIFDKQKAAAVLAVKKEPVPEYIKRNFAVILSGKDKVKRVIEKPRYLTNNLKGCGIYLFDLAIFDAIRRTPRTAMRDEYEITNAIQILIEDGAPVRIANVVKWDMNVTVPYDLIRCNNMWLKLKNKKFVVGDNCRLHKGVTLRNSVIGHNVTITHPVTVTDSVILAGSVVTGRSDIDSKIIAGKTVIPCESFKSAEE